MAKCTFSGYAAGTVPDAYRGRVFFGLLDGLVSMLVPADHGRLRAGGGSASPFAIFRVFCGSGWLGVLMGKSRNVAQLFGRGDEEEQGLPGPHSGR